MAGEKGKSHLHLVGNDTANDNIFPLDGPVFIGRAKYAEQKLRKLEDKIRRLAGMLLAGLAGLSYLSWAAPDTADAPGIFKMGLLVIFMFLPMNAGLFRNYMLMKKVCDINPLVKIDYDGISLWSEPEKTLSWDSIGVFVRRTSKIYALPRMAVFQPDRPHPALIEIDAALLDVKREDLLAYLTSRLSHEHKRGAH